MDRLAWLYHLTPAEARVCVALFQAGSVDGAAEAAGLTRHTVRSHLKRAYAKAGVSTQGQLLQKMAGSLWLMMAQDVHPAAPPDA